MVHVSEDDAAEQTRCLRVRRSLASKLYLRPSEKLAKPVSTDCPCANLMVICLAFEHTLTTYLGFPNRQVDSLGLQDFRVPGSPVR